MDFCSASNVGFDTSQIIEFGGDCINLQIVDHSVDANRRNYEPGFSQIYGKCRV